MSNFIHYNVWDEITFLFSPLQRQWITILRSNWIHVSKRYTRCIAFGVLNTTQLIRDIIIWSGMNHQKCIHFKLRPSSSMNGIFCTSVRPSVRLSHLFDYVPIIVSSWNFQELSLGTRVRSMQKVKVRGQRSRSQRSRPNLTVSGL